MIKKYWKYAVLILVIGLLAADLYFDSQNGLAESPNRAIDAGFDTLPVGTGIGELAPDFSGMTVDGESLQLSELRGKVVLLNDFASWCGPCLAETPHLVEVFNANKGEVAIIGLNLQESESAVLSYRDDFLVTYPLVMDPDGALTGIYRPVGLPTSWFIDPNGVVRYVHIGPMTVEIIQKAIDIVAEGREPDLATLSGRDT